MRKMMEDEAIWNRFPLDLLAHLQRIHVLPSAYHGAEQIFIKGILLLIKVDSNVDKSFKVSGISSRDNEFVTACTGIILRFKFHEQVVQMYCSPSILFLFVLHVSNNSLSHVVNTFSLYKTTHSLYISLWQTEQIYAGPCLII